MVWQVDIGVKLTFWNFNFWLTDIESTDYVWHGTVFIFFNSKKNELSRAFQSWANLPILTFSLKYGQIFHQNKKFKHVPEKQFSWNFFWYMNIYLIAIKKFCENCFSGTYWNFIFRWFSCHFKHKCQHLQIWPTLEGSFGLIFWSWRKIKTVPWPT